MKLVLKGSSSEIIKQLRELQKRFTYVSEVK